MSTMCSSRSAAKLAFNSLANSIYPIGSRQQCGLHGPASGGGQDDAIGNALPDETRPAAALMSFSIFLEPHFGQAGFSARLTSNSAWHEQASH